MKKVLNLIKDWLKHEGKAGPLLICGGREKQRDELIEKLIAWALLEGWTSSADIIKLEAVKSTITIQNVRLVLNRLALTPVARRRLVLIRQADQLSQPAANALLKSLEEGHMDSRYLLATTSRWRILPTIVSRCQIIRLSDTPAAATTAKREAGKASSLRRMAEAQSFSAADFELLGDEIVDRIKSQGATRESKVALLRLRDYYRIKASGGNIKLAKEVLFASWPDNK